MKINPNESFLAKMKRAAMEAAGQVPDEAPAEVVDDHVDLVTEDDELEEEYDTAVEEEKPYVEDFGTIITELPSDACIINIAKMYPDVVIPSKRPDDAGFDIYAHYGEDHSLIVAPPFSTFKVPTGIRSVISNNFRIVLHNRSSLSSNGILVGGGVIDPSYRGEWSVILINTTQNFFVITKLEPTAELKADIAAKIGLDDPERVILWPYTKAIAQAIVERDIPTFINQVSETRIDAQVTERGTGGFGSSGK